MTAAELIKILQSKPADSIVGVSPSGDTQQVYEIDPDPPIRATARMDAKLVIIIRPKPAL